MRWIAPKPLITILLFVSVLLFTVLGWSLGRLYVGPLDTSLLQTSTFTAIPAASPAIDLPTFLFEPSEQALVQLVALEREAANRSNLLLLNQLWDTEGQVIDGRGTVTPEDDYRWRGQRAVLDRYRVLVFPNPPPLRTALPRLLLQPIAEQSLEKNRTDTFERVGSIHLKNGQTQIVATDLDNGDDWQFVFHHGRWWLLVLRYATRPA